MEISYSKTRIRLKYDIGGCTIKKYYYVNKDLNFNYYITMIANDHYPSYEIGCWNDLNESGKIKYSIINKNDKYYFCLAKFDSESNIKSIVYISIEDYKQDLLKMFENINIANN